MQHGDQFGLTAGETAFRDEFGYVSPALHHLDGLRIGTIPGGTHFNLVLSFYQPMYLLFQSHQMIAGSHRCLAQGGKVITVTEVLIFAGVHLFAQTTHGEQLIELHQYENNHQCAEYSCYWIDHHGLLVMPRSSGVIINVLLVVVLRLFGLRFLLGLLARPPWWLPTIL
jgi:hypothetical protein